MFETTELIAPFSAISSWEGFEFQGHMALNFTFTRMLELIKEKGTIENFYLQIEGEEDFSIINDRKYESIHQVKSGSASVKKRNKFAYICTLLDNPGSLGYFHRTPESNLEDSFLRDTLIHTNSLLAEIDKVKEKLNKEILTNTKDQDDYIEKNIPNSNENGSLKKIFNHVKKKNPYFCNKCLLENIENKLIYNACLINRKSGYGYKRFSDNDVKTKIYNDRLFINDCHDYSNSLIIIEDSIGLIKDILDIERPKYFFKDDKKYREYIYYKLSYDLHERITKNRIDGANKHKCVIKFIDIYDVITSNLHKEMDSAEHKYYLIMKSINKAIDEYKHPKRNKCEDFICKNCKSYNESCNLNKQINKIKSYNQQDLRKFIRNLILYTPKNDEPFDLPSSKLVYRLLLDTLMKIECLGLNDSFIISAIKDQISYRLILDENYDVDIFIRDLNEERLKYPDEKIIYEEDVLITDQLVEESFNFYREFFTHIDEDVIARYFKEKSNVRSDYNITKPKEIRLINKEIAIKELG